MKIEKLTIQDLKILNKNKFEDFLKIYMIYLEELNHYRQKLIKFEIRKKGPPRMFLQRLRILTIEFAKLSKIFRKKSVHYHPKKKIKKS